MQIVIDIPEDAYTRLFDNGIQDNEIAVDDVCEMARAIRLGTLLPKGHNRLIDAKEAERKIKMAIDEDLGAQKLATYILRTPSETPTIIEADKENEDKG